MSRTLWTPALLRGRGRAWWWDADYRPSITLDSGYVAEWRDRYNGTPMQNTVPSTTSGPVHERRGGLLGMWFDGARGLRTDTITLADRSDITAFMVASYYTGGASDRYLSYTGTGETFDSASTASIIPFIRSSAFAELSYFWNGYAGTYAMSPDVRYMAMLRKFSTGGSPQAQFRKNGAGYAEGSVGSSLLAATGRFSIGASVAGQGLLRGVVHETLYFSAALSRTEAKYIEGYLAHKWNVRLESNHPFVSSPPMVGERKGPRFNTSLAQSLQVRDGVSARALSTGAAMRVRLG